MSTPSSIVFNEYLRSHAVYKKCGKEEGTTLFISPTHPRIPSQPGHVELTADGKDVDSVGGGGCHGNGINSNTEADIYYARQLVFQFCVTGPSEETIKEDVLGVAVRQRNTVMR